LSAAHPAADEELELAGDVVGGGLYFGGELVWLADRPVGVA
jgi:hypothetical protein